MHLSVRAFPRPLPIFRRPGHCPTIYLTNKIGGLKWNMDMRVSTKEQNEERQLIALHAFGIAKTAIYVDKQFGKDFEWMQL